MFGGGGGGGEEIQGTKTDFQRIALSTGRYSWELGSAVCDHSVSGQVEKDSLGLGNEDLWPGFLRSIRGGSWGEGLGPRRLQATISV